MHLSFRRVISRDRILILHRILLVFTAFVFCRAAFCAFSIFWSYLLKICDKSALHREFNWDETKNDLDWIDGSDEYLSLHFAFMHSFDYIPRWLINRKKTNFRIITQCDTLSLLLCWRHIYIYIYANDELRTPMNDRRVSHILTHTYTHLPYHIMTAWQHLTNFHTSFHNYIAFYYKFSIKTRPKIIHL